jgi:hypothetical protein
MSSPHAAARRCHLSHARANMCVRVCDGPPLSLADALALVLLVLDDEQGRHRRGVVYTWSLWRGKSRLAVGTRTRADVSGSFAVRRVVADRPGTDTLTARATRRGGGETCTVTARI